MYRRSSVIQKHGRSESARYLKQWLLSVVGLHVQKQEYIIWLTGCSTAIAAIETSDSYIFDFEVIVGGEVFRNLLLSPIFYFLCVWTLDIQSRESICGQDPHFKRILDHK